MVMLITGGSGALGLELKKIFSSSLVPDHNSLDITKKKNVFDYFNNHEIDTVIHTAALTKIRSCEENRNLSWKTNVEGTKNLVDVVLESNGFKVYRFWEHEINKSSAECINKIIEII